MSFPKSLIIRMLLFILAGVILAAIFSEVAFRFQKGNTSREPQVIQMVIPAGTSEKVAQGESILPSNASFVLGDTLEVINQDSVTQILGPLVIPPGASASMKLDQAGSLSYTCSFQPTNYYGIHVQPAVTLAMRLEAALLAGIPLGILIGLYSLIVKPIKPKISPPQM